jgi:hypothetical protein
MLQHRMKKQIAFVCGSKVNTSLYKTNPEKPPNFPCYFASTLPIKFMWQLQSYVHPTTDLELSFLVQIISFMISHV